MRKHLVIFSTILLIFLSCKKEINTKPKEPTNDILISSSISCDNGLLKFKSIDAYTQISAKEEAYIKRNLHQHIAQFSNFKPLRTISNTNKILSAYELKEQLGSINKTTEDTVYGDTSVDELYPDYLLEILNADSIVQIGNYIIKVDMINERALVLHTSNSSQYNDLVNNNLSNVNVMQFNMDDDVMDVLEWMDNGGTYSGYSANKTTGCSDPKASRKKVAEMWYYAAPTMGVRADCKIVYQNFLIFHNLIAKIKSQKSGGLFGWTSHTNKILKIKYNIKYKVRCQAEVDLWWLADSISGQFYDQSGISAPVEIHYNVFSGKRFAKYDFRAIFYIKEWESIQPWASSEDAFGIDHFRIKSNY